MSTIEPGFDPGTPTEVTFSISFLAKDEEAANGFVISMNKVVDRAASEMARLYNGRVEIVEEIELPPTELRSRDEV